jgi:exopolysaccharide biosynthesis predicted pyruvyltransferase EpsI
MSPLFDLPYKIKHDIVLYKHASKEIPGPPILGLPELNNRASMDVALEFIASGEVVITNSYHGAYWATLLGRKVICIPFSSKFYGYKFPPTYSNSINWIEDIKKTLRYTDALEDCRRINKKFYQLVLSMLGD